jgi:hypothetical protein
MSARRSLRGSERRCNRWLLGLAAVVGLASLARPASSQCRGERLRAIDVGAFDWFGWAVAVRGDVAVASFPSHFGAGPCVDGAAWVFERAGAGWEPTTMLEGFTCTEFGFGASVAVDGDVVVVGVPDHRLPGNLVRGAARVFRRGALGWSDEATLVPSDSEFGGAGSSVAIEGDTIIVGDPAAFVDGFGGGAVYVFRREALGWVEEQKLTASDAVVGAQFGWSVSVSGDRIAVGAMDDDDLGLRSGSAYVFRRTASGWIEEAKLIPSDGANSSRFGQSISISHEAILVGAVEYGGPLRPGSAYVFRWDGASWSEEARLRGTNLDLSSFGCSVSLDCDVALIGAFTRWSASPGVGAAYLFERTSTGWVMREEIADCSDDANYEYGRAVALSGDTALVSALGDDEMGEDAGAVFALTVQPKCGCATCDDLYSTIASASIDNEGVRHSLRVKAMSACRAYGRGQVVVAGNVLCALVSQCDAQDGQHVEPASAAAIRTCVRSVGDALGIPLGRCGRAVPPRAGPRGRR